MRGAGETHEQSSEENYTKEREVETETEREIKQEKERKRLFGCRINIFVDNQ